MTVVSRTRAIFAFGALAWGALTFFTSAAHAVSTGTDLNLSNKAAAGGMAGAAYTRPQEASAAVFGNPATLTRFDRMQANFGASWLYMQGVDNRQTADIPGVATFSNTSSSDANDYILPDFGAVIPIDSDFAIGAGVEVDAGLGGDYRDDPIKLLGGAGGAAFGGDFDVPLLVELISFNANLAAAYDVTPELSVGAALTIGFGLAQLGTVGPTNNLDTLCGALGTAPVFCDFGGTTASVHDIGVGGSVGFTYEPMSGLIVGGTYKSKLKYEFRDILHAIPQTGASGDGFQRLNVEQPAEFTLGVALDGLLHPDVLLEADLLWKNWEDADAYGDVYEDQLLVMLGGQYTRGPWRFRLGYSFAEDIFADRPNNTLDQLSGLGTIPLGEAGDPIATDIVALVQTTLVPIIWQHTVAAGIGYEISDSVRMDAYVSSAFAEEEGRDAPAVAATVDALVGTSGTSVRYDADIDNEWLFGIGVTLELQ